MIGGHARFIGQEVEGAEQVRSAVRAQIAAGAAVIKVIASGGVLTPGTSPDQAQMTVEELRAAVDEAQRVSFKNALRDGIQIAIGTDAGTPFNFHGENAQELERMVAFGMSPMQAILASTSAAVRLIGIQDQVGTIKKGKLADLLLFKGNPLRSIDLLRDRSRIIGVMQVGKFVAGPLSRT